MAANIQLGAKLTGLQGHDLGEVKYLVANRDSGQVTHLVVEKGLFGLEQKVVEAGHIRRVSGDGRQAELDLTKEQLKDLPDYIERYYTKASPQGELQLPPDTFIPSLDAGFPAMPGYLYPVAGAPMGTGWQEMADAEYHEDRHVPDNSIVIKEGATVEARDGDLGKLKEVQYDESGRVENLVVEDGLFKKEETEVPVGLIEEIDDEQVRLHASQDEVSGLNRPQE